MQIAFLISDSRSGSTLLSREMANRLSGLFVPPELTFDELIECSDARLQEMSLDNLVALLFSKKQLVNLALSREQVRGILEAQCAKPRRVAQIIECIILEFAKRSGIESPKAAVLKGGRENLYLPKIADAFGKDTRIIHIYRDPRAVISSKLRARRPRHRHEVMAWGGSLLAGMQWKVYSRKVRDAASEGLSVLDIRYEEFMEAQEQTLVKVAEFLGTEIAPASGKNVYQIPTNESDIHANVAACGIKRERANAWRNELGRWDKIVIEAVTQEEMLQRGYRPAHLLTWIQRTAIMAATLPELVFKLLRHYSFRAVGR